MMQCSITVHKPPLSAEHIYPRSCLNIRAGTSLSPRLSLLQYDINAVNFVIDCRAPDVDF